jgi:DNA-binding transcriptional regulator PaaX
MKANTVIKGLTKGILVGLGVGAVIGVALVFPGLGYVYKELDKQKWEKARKRGALRSTVKRLEKQQLIAWQKGEKGELQLVLTKEGKRKALLYTIDALMIPKPTTWDKLWRVVVFDIPEEKRLARDIFRKKLKDLEFYKLQRSVFVHPYDCREVIEFLRENLEITDHVHFILAKDISGLNTKEHNF